MSDASRPSRLPAPASGKKPPAAKPAAVLPVHKRTLESASSSSMTASATKKARPNGHKTPLVRNSVFSRSMVRLPATATDGASGFSRSNARNGKASAFERSVMEDCTNKTTLASQAEKKPKRKVWDLKGRLEDMESQFEMTRNKVASLEEVNQKLEKGKTEGENRAVTASAELQNLRSAQWELKGENENLKRAAVRMEQSLNEITRAKHDLENSLDRKVKNLEDELSAKEAEVSQLRCSVAELVGASAEGQARCKIAESKLDTAFKRIEELESLSASQGVSIQEYEQKTRSYETERRRLHNMVQELKGNIRVFCRVRPLLNTEMETSKVATMRHINITGDKSMEVSKIAENPNAITGKAEKYCFDFDRVFSTDAKQKDVFEEVSQMVQSAIDGYNVCIFAYGQTGSGKTFTMEGGVDEGEEGIIPRTIAKIYEEALQLEGKGWKYQMEASFVEIYNEEIRDLLATEKGLKYEIKRVGAKSQEVFVTNLTVEDVTDGEIVGKLLQRAHKNRAVAATNCNERSSRSHSIFMLKIQGCNSLTSESCIGTLNLVDLAGSERLKDSGSTGQRLEETKNINGSLSVLNKVIMALANNKDGNSHVPYRDSKLTHLLMNSLGGKSKVLMFVNLSPREESFNESLNSLRFATRVNQCHIGSASRRAGTAFGN